MKRLIFFVLIWSFQITASQSPVNQINSQASVTTNYYKKLPHVLLSGQNTNIVITWQLTGTHTCTFEYGTDTTYADGTIQTTENSSSNNEHIHTVTLNNLTAGQTYYYRVSINNTNIKTGSFEAFASDNDQELTFFAYGDTRTYPSDHNDVAEAIMNDISTNNLKHTFVINSGDLVNDGDDESSWRDEFFDQQYTHISDLLANLPYVAALGNHEESGTLFEKYFPYHFQNNRYYYSFDYGPAHITVIDQFTRYSVGSTQYNWIVNDLETTNKLWKIVVFHKPGWSAEGHSNDTNVQNILQPIFVDKGVKFVITGHNHYYARAVVDGINHITTGGGGAPLYRPDTSQPNIVTAEKTYHYCKLHINANTLHFSAIRSNGTEIESFDVSIENPQEMLVKGNDMEIQSGDTTPSQIDATDFRHVRVAGNTSVSRIFTIYNTGGDDLELNGTPVVSITGTNASDFTLTSLPATTVAGGSNTSFTIKFDPSASGLRTAKVTIDNNDTDENPYTFDIQGTGAKYTDCKGIDYVQDFESTPAQPELTIVSQSNAFDNTSGLTANTLYPQNENYYTSGNNALYIHGNHNGVLKLGPVDTRNYTEVYMTLRLAAFSGANNNGMDADDYVVVSVSNDDGDTYSKEIKIKGNNNAKWSFDTGTGLAQVTYDGDNNPRQFSPDDGGNRTLDGYSTIRIRKLPKVEKLRIKISTSENSNDEYWLIDDVKIIGRKTTTWDGSAWSNGDPSRNKKVIFNADYDTANGDIHTCECEIKQGKTLRVSDDSSLVVETDIINNGTLFISNKGSLVQRKKDAVSIGTGIFQLDKTSLNINHYYDYVFWSSPLKSKTFTLGDIVLNAWRYYQFDLDQSQGWVMDDANTIAKPGKAYAISAPNGTNSSVNITAHFVKDHDPFNNGNIKVNIYKKGTTSDDALNYNLIGNPYPSAIDFNALVDDNTSINGSYYLWTNCAGLDTNGHHQQSGYTTYSTSGTAIAACNDSNNPTAGRYIATGQGFFVEATSDNSTLTFKNKHRVSDNNDNFVNRPNDDYHVAWLNITDDTGHFTQIAVGFYPGATAGFDRMFDAHSINEGTDLAMYVAAGDHKLAIDGLPDTAIDGTRVPLTLEVSAASNLTISLDRQTGLDDYDIYLYDNETQNSIDLKTGNYRFNIDAGICNDRFELIFNATSDIEDNTLPDNAIVLSQQQGIFTLQSVLDNEQIQDLTVYDINGRTLFAKSGLNSQQTQVDLSNLPNGSVVLFKIMTTGQKMAVKKAVKLK